MAYITESDLIGLGYDLFTTLGTVTSPTVTASGTGGTITAGTYSVVIAALNLTAAGTVLLNYQEAELTIDPSNGVTLPSDSVTATVLTGNNIYITINPLVGAAAYAVFVGPVGEETLQIISTAYNVTLTKLVADGTSASEITADTSGDTVAINNICQWSSDLADGYCRQHLGLISSEIEDCQARIKDGVIKVFPRYLPLSGISTMTLNSNDLNTELTITSFKVFSLLGFGMAKSTTFSDGTYFGQITYSHGYTTIPSEIKTAVILIAQTILDDFFFAKLTEIAGAESIKQGQLTIQRTDTVKLPENATIILDKYRRVR
jgi:hypothetical protein